MRTVVSVSIMLSLWACGDDGAISKDASPDDAGAEQDGDVDSDGAVDAMLDAPADAPALVAHLTSTPASVIFTGAVTRASQDQLVEIANDGTAMATSLAIALDFTNIGYVITSNTCATSLGVGASCFINLRHQPIDRGTFIAKLALTAADGVATDVPIESTAIRAATFEIRPGVSPLPAVGVAATRNVPILVENIGDQTSGTVGITLVNPDLGLSLQAGGCTSTLAPGGVCTANLTINPPAAGTLDGTIRVTASPGAQSTLAIQVDGVAPAQLAVGPVAAFGSVVIGGTADRTWTFYNTGAAPTGPLAITLTTPLPVAIIADSCTGTALSGGASCSVTARFTPASSTANVVEVKATATPGNIAARMVDARAVTAANVVFAAAVPAFGDVEIGSHAFHTFRITNTGEALSGPVGFLVSAAYFTLDSHDCGVPLAQNQSCTITVKFEPSLLTPVTGTLTVTSATSSPAPLTLTGTGVLPSGLQVDPQAGDGGRIAVGATRTTTVTLRNTNTTMASGPIGRSVFGDTSQFAVASTCDGVNIAASGTCAFLVTYQPTTAGSHSITISMSSNLNAVAPTVSGLAIAQGPVNITTTGNGRVTGTGIDCGTDCSTTGALGSTLVLTAAPATGYVLSGWTGCGSTSGNQCTVTIAKVTDVTATFAPVPNTLTVNVVNVGTATGMVVATSAINCGNGASDCTESVAPDATVVLVATPTDGYGFGGWSGACDGFEYTCAVPMSQARTVSAHFSPVNKIFTTGENVWLDGGLSQGDSLCQTAATNASLSGTFRALLARPGFDAWDRLAGARGWVNTVALPVADRPSDFGVGLSATVGYTAAGLRLLWGFAAVGTAESSCDGWTSTSTTDTVPIGIVNTTAQGWLSLGGLNNCANTWPNVGATLVCAQIDYVARPTFYPASTPAKRAFVTETPIAASSGITGFDQQCQLEATTAGLLGTFVALVSTTTVPALSRLVSNVMYRRVDGAAIGTQAMFDGGIPMLLAGIDLQADGVRSEAVQVATGGFFTKVADPTMSCNNWSEATDPFSMTAGFAGSADTWFFWAQVTGCGLPVRFYCVQQ